MAESGVGVGWLRMKIKEQRELLEPPGRDEYGGGGWSDKIGLRVFQPSGEFAQ